MNPVLNKPADSKQIIELISRHCGFLALKQNTVGSLSARSKRGASLNM